MKRIVSSLLILIFYILFCFSCTSPIYAVNNTETNVNIKDVNTNCPSCILIDAKFGNILYSKDAYKKMYPASTTKLMTAILTLENCELADVVTVSHNAIFSIPVGYAHASLREGEELTVEQLLNVLLIPSANDAAIALAEHISGSVEEFSSLMNNKAKEIGCKNTNFVNPNGIHDKNHYSTAYDLSLIGKYAMKFPDIMRIAKTTRYTLPKTNKYNKTDRIFNATNSLIVNQSQNDNYYKYATGLKTGFTDKAGYCIVSTTKKDDLELLAVILNGESIDKRYFDCKSLFEYGFNNYSYFNIVKSSEVIQNITIENATKETKNLDVIAKNDINVLLEKETNIESLKHVVEIQSDLKAPIAENSVIGKVSYNIDGKTYSSDLIASSDVYPSSFEVIVFRILLIFLILYIIYRLLKHNSDNKHYKKSKTKRKKVKKRVGKSKGNFKFTQINDYL